MQLAYSQIKFLKRGTDCRLASLSVPRSGPTRTPNSPEARLYRITDPIVLSTTKNLEKPLALNRLNLNGYDVFPKTEVECSGDLATCASLT